MEYKDYYKILDIKRDASAEDIKKRYRRLARKYHPDVSTEPNAEEQFKQVKEAYEVLKDPEKRKAYDQLGSQWQGGQGFTPPPGWEFHQQGQRQQQSQPFHDENFSDFFENLFGQRGHPGQQRGFQMRGQDQHVKLNISLENAYHGLTQNINLQQPELNPATHQMQMKQKTLNVKIPAGVIQGQQIRLSGQGGAGMGGGPNGDLFIEIHFLPHKNFTISNRDVYLKLPVSPWEAALGAKVTVPTLGGNVDLTIPPHSQTGQKLRLKGRGLSGQTPGDQYITLHVYIPEPKTEEQKNIYREMASKMNFNPRSLL